jgi:hypothetical protein
MHCIDFHAHAFLSWVREEKQQILGENAARLLP